MHQECMCHQEHLLQAKITLKISTLKFSVFIIFHSLSVQYFNIEMQAEHKRSNPNAIKRVLTIPSILEPYLFNYHYKTALVIKQISCNYVESRNNDSDIYTPHASKSYLSSSAFLAIEPADRV